VLKGFGMSAAKAAKSILVVDDDELFRVSVVEGAGHFDPSWRLRSAENGAAALALLLEEEADLVVTDLHMPVLDGFQFLAAIQQQGLRPQVIVVSAHATAESQGKLAPLGSLSCIAKPVDLPHLFQCFERALTSPRSVVDGLTLSGFSQLLGIERHTCLLRAWDEDRVADLVFDQGELIDARLGALTGRAAALEILAWRQAHLEVLPAVDLETRTIEETLSFLLLEAARNFDENQQQGAPPKPARPSAVELSGSFAALRFDAPEEPAFGSELDGLGKLEDAFFGGILLDVATGEVVASFGQNEIWAAHAAGNAEMLRAELDLVSQLGSTQPLEDIAMILTSEVQIFRPFGETPGIFLVAVFDRVLFSLAAARLQMAAIEKDLLALHGQTADRTASSELPFG
jgi:CheY-like chemotaxis protein